MNCPKCGSERIAEVSAKCSDLCVVSVAGFESDGYVPTDMGIGGGDYVEFDYCMDCGQMMGEFPLPASRLEV